MIAVLGEGVVDLVADPDGRTFHAAPGGSPLNVAVALSRLGLLTHLMARVNPDDLFGRMLLDHVTAAGVDTSWVVRASEPASIAAAAIDAAGRASYSFAMAGSADRMWRPDELPPHLPATVTALHTGSLAVALPPGAAEIEALLHREQGRATLSYDPNVRPALLGPVAEERERAERLVATVDVVKASDEDLAWLFPGSDPLVVARRWQASGPALVVVTLGAAGSIAVTAERERRVPPRQVQVVDTVGAGDTFMAGLLAGLAAAGLLGSLDGTSPRDRLAAGLDDVTLDEVLALAADAAAMVCTRRGADPPSRDEIAAFRADRRLPDGQHSGTFGSALRG